jgi:hypothetical protein
MSFACGGYGDEDGEIGLANEFEPQFDKIAKVDLTIKDKTFWKVSFGIIRKN